jgi:hypothetical protein
MEIRSLWTASGCGTRKVRPWTPATFCPMVGDFGTSTNTNLLLSDGDHLPAFADAAY